MNNSQESRVSARSQQIGRTLVLVSRSKVRYLSYLSYLSRVSAGLSFKLCRLIQNYMSLASEDELLDDCIARMSRDLINGGGDGLSEVEQEVIRGSAQKLSYEELGLKTGYSDKYLCNDLGPKLWQRLSALLGKKITKKNIGYIILETYGRESDTRKSLETHERLLLAKTLNTLPQSFFNELLFALNFQKKDLEDESTSRSDQTVALLNWVEGPEGPGLNVLSMITEEIIYTSDNPNEKKVAFTIAGSCSYKDKKEIELFIDLLLSKIGDDSVKVFFTDES